MPVQIRGVKLGSSLPAGHKAQQHQLYSPQHIQPYSEDPKAVLLERIALILGLHGNSYASHQQVQQADQLARQMLTVLVLSSLALLATVHAKTEGMLEVSLPIYCGESLPRL